ncbi:hypothetical protein BD626DRAFT_566567 [Schizophyllum amplum]|uniref:Uncharacterized protein n=1 Tax=Schizophyllum amplum TaxID=97359 RepID=A0A550CMA8_9AGAR|nr:hypothetical protein BD626DRAFT_566567 [Auriculariopsis ampla]
MASEYGPYGAEPFEEASGGPGRTTTASRADLKAFYADMERKEKLERQASKSKRKSGSGHGLFHRKSMKRGASAVPPVPVPVPVPSPDAGNDSRDPPRRGASIIPDVLPERPDWFTLSHWVIVPGQVVKYSIHNPVGPRWYRNLHLKPPSVARARPSSFFSPSFPPMASASVQERSEDSVGPLSRSPSNSPLPTPSSSQVRIAPEANGKPRSRKTSLTAAHDTVDLLDASDPYGMNWHHQSPYDAGITSPSVVDSTSAVHLRPPSTADPDGARIPRKLSKRRAPLLGAFKGGKDDRPTSMADHGVASLPTTPVEADMPVKASKSEVKLPISASMTTLPTSGGDYPSACRCCSVIRKPQHSKQESITSTQTTGQPAATDDSVSQGLQEWQHIGADDAKKETDGASPPAPPADEPASPAPASEEPSPLSPPPIASPASQTPSAPPTVEVPRASKDADNRSSISIEAPFSIGRLTVANPDAELASEAGTPMMRAAELLAEVPPPQKRSSAPMLPELSFTQAPRASPASVETGRPTSGNSAATASQATAAAASQASSQVHQPVPQKDPKFPRVASSATYRSSESSTRPSRASYDSQRPGPPSVAPRASSSSPDKRHAVTRSQDQEPSKSSRRSHERERTPSSASRLVISSPKAMSPSSGKHTPTRTPSSGNGKRSSHSAPPPWAAPPPQPPFAAMDNTPLSNAATLACFGRTDIASQGPPTCGAQAVGEPSPSLSATYVRRTETFRLVRSESGNVYASATPSGRGGRAVGGNGVAEGQPEPVKNKGKERDSAEAARRQSKDHRSRRATTSEVQQEASRTEEPKASRRRSEDRGRHSEDRAHQSTDRMSPHKPTPPTPASAPARPLERAPSKTVRPTSEMPAADELNAVRAREAWEMERLFKAKSMSTDEWNSRRISSEASSTPPPRPISKDLDAMLAHGDAVVAHGSSHTAYVVQSLQGGRRNSASAPRPEVVLPSLAADRLAVNPLPEPPRESDYKPAPFPVMKLESKLQTPDHWTKLHDGLTTAH